MAIRKIPTDTETFHYHNENPKNKRAADCVIRAIATASGMTWEEVYDRLYEIGRKNKTMISEEATYKRLLEEIAFRRNQPRKLNGRKYTGSEFCRMWNDDRAIVAHLGSHHVVAIMPQENGGYRVYDTWNSTGECIGKFWVIRER